VSKAERFKNLRRNTPPEQIQGTKENARQLIQITEESTTETLNNQEIGTVTPDTQQEKVEEITGKSSVQIKQTSASATILDQFEKKEDQYDKHTLLIRKDISRELLSLCEGRKKGFKTAFINMAIEEAIRRLKEETQK
jgi:hypothetical protein